MPEHVWRCEFCSECNKTFDETNKHEKYCSFNPKNKYCYTCSNYLNDKFWMHGESYTCLKNLSINKYENEGNCESWNSI